MLNAARQAGIKKFLFASTGGALIGDAEPPVSEESVPKPVSPYGASKLCGEAYCNAFAGSYNMETVMLRFANVYGPVSAHKKGAVTVFIKSLLRDEPITIYGDGHATRDFLHVQDLCRGINMALEKSLAPGTTLHLATGKETSILELAKTLATVAGKPEHPILHQVARQGEVIRNFANYDRANDLLGFAPNQTLEQGLKECWDWFVEQGDTVFEIETTES
jgi:UDP-glucose 4-epimerase